MTSGPHSYSATIKATKGIATARSSSFVCRCDGNPSIETRPGRVRCPVDDCWKSPRDARSGPHNRALVEVPQKRFGIDDPFGFVQRSDVETTLVRVPHLSFSSEP